MEYLDREALGFILFVLLMILLWVKWTWQTFTCCFFLAGFSMLFQGGIGTIFGVICIAIGTLFLLVLLGREPNLMRKLLSETESHSGLKEKNVANPNVKNDIVSGSIQECVEPKSQQQSNCDIKESITPEELQNIRKSLSKTQKEMATILNVTAYTWGKWEKGVEVPDPNNQEKINNLILYLKRRG